MKTFLLLTARVRAFLPALLLVLGACAASAATWNVNDQTSINAAIAGAAPGDTIIVANGTYTFPVVINGNHGTATNPITFKAASLTNVLFTGSSVISNAKLEVARNWWVVDGFKFTNIVTTLRSSAVRFKGATNSILRNCSFKDCGTTSTDSTESANTHSVVLSGGSASNIVERCSFEGTVGGTCFHIPVSSTGSDSLNRDNVFRYNLLTGSVGDAGGEPSVVRIGTGAASAADLPTNTTLEHNLWQDLIIDSAANVLYLKCGQNTVRYNTFRNLSDGVYLRRGFRQKVIGNYFFNSGGIRLRAEEHLVANNYLEGPITNPPLTSKLNGIQVSAGGDVVNGNQHEVAFLSTVTNNTVVYIGYNTFTLGNQWNTTSIDLNDKAPYSNTFSGNLFVNDAGQAVYRYVGGGSTCPDSNNVWTANVVWSVTPGTSGYTPTGVNVGNPGLTRDIFGAYVGTNTVGGVAPANYGAHMPFRSLTTNDVGPGSTYIAGSIPEVNVTGNGVNIADGDTTPSTADGTDFGSADIAGATVTRVFTVLNTGSAALTVGSVSLSGTQAADFAVTVQPAASVAAGGSTTFSVRFDASATGLRTASASFSNNDANENPYNLSIQGTGTAAPEANVTGNGVSIADGDTTPSTADFTDFGSADLAGATVTRVFTVQNTGSASLTVGAVSLSGTHAADFAVTVQPAASVAAGGSTTFSVRFDPSATGLRTASVSFSNNDADENPYNFSIQGTGTSSDITAGLVGGWKMNEASGTSAADFSGNGFTANFEAGASLSGGVANINGGTQRGVVAYNALLKPTNFTVSVWAKADVTGSTLALFKAAGGSGYDSGFALLQSASGAAQLRWGSGTASDGSLSSTNTAATTWRHIVGTYDGSAMRLYVNGALAGTDTTVTFSHGTGTGPQYLGDSNGVTNFDGQEDDVRVYNRALSASEITTLYNNNRQ